MRPRPDLISVVVPAYEAAGTLAEQLEALAAQDYDGAWEVVVADNGSTDGTVDIARAWADRLPSLVVVDASEIRGVAHARNVGVRAARGDFVAICDADDRASSGWLTAMAEAARTADLVGGRLDASALNDERTRRARTAHPDDRLPTAWGFLPYAVGANVGVHVAVLDAIGCWRTDYPFGSEDVELSWRAQLASFRLAFAPGAVVHYRYRSGTRAVVRQAHDRGLGAVQLYRDYRAHGASARRPAVVAKVWWWILSRAVVAALVPARRGAWVRSAAFNAGLVRGSARWRVICL